MPVSSKSAIDRDDAPLLGGQVPINPPALHLDMAVGQNRLSLELCMPVEGCRGVLRAAQVSGMLKHSVAEQAAKQLNRSNDTDNTLCDLRGPKGEHHSNTTCRALGSTFCPARKARPRLGLQTTALRPISAVETSFATSEKQTLAATTLEVAVRHFQTLTSEAAIVPSRPNAVIRL
jgi:hypothetical protein